MATRIAARYVSRRLSSSGKVLGEEEKAAENIYIKVTAKIPLVHFLLVFQDFEVWSLVFVKFLGSIAPFRIGICHREVTNCDKSFWLMIQESSGLEHTNYVIYEAEICTFT